MDDKTNSVEVFAGTGWQAEMVKNLLENEGISSFLKNEIIGTILPFGTSPGGVGAIKVIVSEEFKERAMAVVTEYLKNLTEEE
ncbi:MAG: DUF2007-related protein [Bacteroidales bacterium]|jgi:hypothetical protein|nr:DUF2007-related protein [Bacteroidales bacterium]MDD3273247.1 DUF2007-related protein [Bacteroidales bacterium]MDD4058791.1 DUF2007-related protein [Bacteroidales bacterium]